MIKSAPQVESLYREKIAAVFPCAREKSQPADYDHALPGLCSNLYDSQVLSWPAFARAVTGLAAVSIRDLSRDGCTLKVQYNPVRLASGSARIDAASIAARPCFLCPEHLYPEQRGILYQEAFLILCNPAPIFHRHYTITSLAHEPQDISGHLETFFELSRDLGEGMTLFYNGPACGASAPDHLHFQAAPAGAIPIEGDLAQVFGMQPHRKIDGIDLWTIASWGRTMLLARSRDPAALAAMMRRWVDVGRISSGQLEEPMLNLLAFYREGEWRLVLFPRRRHRPAAYDRLDPERLLISPGAVDMGGLIITPREIDYNRLDPETLREIFQEVSSGQTFMEEISACV